MIIPICIATAGDVRPKWPASGKDAFRRQAGPAALETLDGLLPPGPVVLFLDDLGSSALGRIPGQ